MKLLFVLFVSALAVAQVMSTSLDDEQEWTNFKVKYNKYYGSSEEEANRMKVFLDNKRLIEEHNIKYKNGEVSYAMGLNEFSDLTHEEFKKKMGLGIKVTNPLSN